jgi:pyruvate dehydrogenase E2 component (dihydrolipoamide acetyltransferase)
MPRFDPEMKSGKVVEWLKKEGEQVRKGEPIVRIDTEKVSIEVESPESGTLQKILVGPDEEVPVGTPLGNIELDGETPAASPVESKKSLPEITQQAAPNEGRAPHTRQKEAERQRIIASPSARRVARELGIELGLVKGTGPMGRVMSKDVEKYASTQRQTAPREKESFRARKLDSMRSRIAERMVESWTKVPQVPLFAEVDLTETEKFRSAMEKMIGEKVSLTAVVTKALASALRFFPDINSRYENDEIHEFEDVDVGIAVALGNGLVAPVVRKANRKTATEITKEIEDLAARARAGKLGLHEVHGGTTSVSNLSSYGVDYFVPLINPPQVSIVGIGRVRKTQGGNPSCTITFVFDHRVTDGARAAEVLEKIREYMESPYLLQMG